MSSKENNCNVNDAVTKNVMNYFKKYSQNPELPKYFSGTSVSYLPEFKETIEVVKPEIVIQTELDIVITNEEKNEPETTSRASSVMSNKKLEWDNGADIGYNNYQLSEKLHRSCSLPVITSTANNNEETSKLCKLTGNTDNKIKLFILSHSDSETHSSTGVPLYSSKSSSSVEEKKPVYSTTSSGNSSRKKTTSRSDNSSQNISEFISTLSYLKKKIGLPDAQSTPQSAESNTNISPMIVETPVLSKPHRFIKDVSKDIKINSIKPSIMSLKKNQTTVTKSVKLCLTKPLSLECLSSPKKLPTETPTEPVKCSVGIQTDAIPEQPLFQGTEADVVFQNQAVEYCEHTDSDPTTVSTQTGSSLIVSNCNSFEYQKSYKSISNHQRKLGSCQDSSDEISISLKYQGEDIEKNTNMLQKLIKSKKYDNHTKKIYIKKILQNIMESKYLEESSNSSDLFFPKRSKTMIPHLLLPHSTDSSSKSVQNLSQKSTPSQQCQKSSPKKKRNAQKMLTTEIQSLECSEVAPEVTPLNSACKNENHSASKLDSAGLSYQNWKEDKTYSEKLFEASHSPNGDGDYLTQVASKERKNQLHWINHEMEYLAKLKNLLELRDTKQKTSQHKFTSVYVVSDDSDKPPSKYIIETNLGATTSSNRKFKFGSDSYTVKEVSDKKSLKSQQTVGDIEVNSNESTLNIKVTTFCEGCKRSPCICSLPDKTKNGSTSSCCHKKRFITKENVSRRSFHCPLCELYDCKGFNNMPNQAENYTGLFIPLQEQPHIEDCCRTCLKSPCQCGNSLKKVFDECQCKGNLTCKCDFVEKLYRHFKASKANRENMGVQTQLDLGSDGIETDHEQPKNVVPRTGSSKESFVERTIFEAPVHQEHSEINEGFKQFHTSSLPAVGTDDVTNILQKQQSDEANLHAVATEDIMPQKFEDFKPFDESNLPQIGSEDVTDVLQKDSAGFQNQYQQTVLTSDDRRVKSPKSSMDEKCIIVEEPQVNGALKNSGTLPKTEVEKIEVTHPQAQAKLAELKDPVETQQSQNVYDFKFKSSGQTITDAVIEKNLDLDEKTSRKLNSRTDSTKGVQTRSVFDKNTQSDPKNSGTSSTAISFSGNTISSSSSSFLMTCICCKHLKDNKKITLQHYNNEVYPLCSKCVKRKPVLTSICYSGPGYMCRCSPLTRGESPIQRTQEYCSCVKPLTHQHTQYCCHCQYKLRKTLQSKNGIAYTLTLEEESPRKGKMKKKKKKKDLEEIKVKIPNPYSKKRHKDKENLFKREQVEPSLVGESNVDDSNDGTNIKISVNSTYEDSKQTGTETTMENTKFKPRSILTLQEHLVKNRPDFIDSAENRRHVLLNAKYNRELRKDDVKIKFLDENSKLPTRPKLFTEREMREITKKNYKKLPEVQQKLKSNREQRLRNADKCIVNALTKKIQRSILKGKSRFPIDTNIVNVCK